jgi:hypothetical protein
MGDRSSEVKIDLWKIINILLGMVLGVFSYVLDWAVKELLNHNSRLVVVESTMLTNEDGAEIDKKIHLLEREVLTDGRFTRR